MRSDFAFGKLADGAPQLLLFFGEGKVHSASLGEEKPEIFNPRLYHRVSGAAKSGTDPSLRWG